MERTIPFLTALVLALANPAFAQRVYDNSTTDLNTNFRIFDGETVGDEINLALDSTRRQITDFSFQYYGISFSGNESARVRFFDNTGSEWFSSGALRPNNLLWDSGVFSIGPTNRATLNFDLTLENIVVPNNFTWTVQFTGIEVGENVGLSLYDPPTVGESFPDYWFFQSGAWELRTNATTPINFGARFDAVPEPSVWALWVAGGLCGFFLLRRRSTKG